MSNEIIISEDSLVKYLDIVGQGKNLTKEEKANFIEIAKSFQLNPFKREVYITAYGEGQFRKTSIITGYEVYLKRAEATERLDGWHITTSGKVNDSNFQKSDLKATITIYRKDRKHPFVHEVYYSEYVQTTKDKNTHQLRPNSMWEKMPITMIKKVAIGQGFRLCFPVELGGLPYLSEEITGKDEETSINEIPKVEIKEEPKKEIIVEVKEEPKTYKEKILKKIDSIRKGEVKGKDGNVVEFSKESIVKLKDKLNLDLNNKILSIEEASDIIDNVLNPIIDNFNEKEIK